MEWKLLLTVAIGLSVTSSVLGSPYAGFIAAIFGAVIIVSSLPRFRAIGRPARGPWLLLYLGGTTAFLGGLARAVHANVSGVSFPLPSPADALYLPTYVLLALGLWSFVRARGAGRDPDAWADALMAASGIAIVSWIAFMAEYTTDASVPESERLINLGYLIGTTGLLAVTLRILAAPGVRAVPYYLLSGAVLCLWAADMVGNVASVLGNDPLVVTFSLPLIYGLCFAAMWHPKTESLAAEPNDTEPRLGPLRVVLLTFSLFGPQLALVAWSSSLEGAALVSSVAAVIALDLAAIARIAQLIRSRERLLKLADEVRVAGDRLLATIDVEEIELVAAESIRGVLLVQPYWAGLVTADDVILGDVPSHIAALVRESPDSEIRAHHPQSDAREIFALRIPHPDGQSSWLAVGTRYQLRRHDRQVLRALANEASMAMRGAQRALAVAEAEAERRFALAIVDSERRQRALLLHSSDIVAVIADDWTIKYISPPVENALGYSPQDLEGSSLKALILDGEAADFERMLRQANADGSSSGEVRVVDRDGGIKLFHIAIGDHRNSADIDGMILNIRDISATRALEEQLDRDPVTGALNRDAFLKRVDSHLRHRPTSTASHGIIVVQIRDLDLVTNATGYESSDTILVEVADRLHTNVRIGDDLARIDGSSFAVLVDRIISESDLAELADRIRTDVSRPLQVGASLVPIAASCGAALSPYDISASDSFTRAMAAAATSRELGSEIEIYRQGIEEGYQLQLEVRSRLRTAITDGDFKLHYQPIVSIGDQRVHGAEALLRWTHPERGPVGPNVFIPEAERSGLIVDLGAWVVDAACRQLGEWIERGLVDDTFRLAVNVSGGQLQPALVESFAAALDRHRVRASMIRVELTETMFAADGDTALEVIRHLAGLGHSIAVDDFGTGASNLARLGRFPIDVVKIDRSLVAPLEQERPRDVELVDSTLKLIEGVGAEAVAEGIETPTQALILRRLGCQFAQGFFYGRPVDPTEFASHFLDERPELVQVGDN